MTEHANETNATDETAQGLPVGAADIWWYRGRGRYQPDEKIRQNFAIDPGTVCRIVREAGVTADESSSAEVGPDLVH